MEEKEGENDNDNDKSKLALDYLDSLEKNNPDLFDGLPQKIRDLVYILLSSLDDEYINRKHQFMINIYKHAAASSPKFSYSFGHEPLFLTFARKNLSRKDQITDLVFQLIKEKHLTKKITLLIISLKLELTPVCNELVMWAVEHPSKWYKSFSMPENTPSKRIIKTFSDYDQHFYPYQKK